MFCIWVLPWVGRHISWALVALSGVLIALSLSMLAATALTDPGFIPRSPLDEDVEYGCAPRRPTPARPLAPLTAPAGFQG